MHRLYLVVTWLALSVASGHAQSPILRNLPLPSAVRNQPVLFQAQDSRGNLWVGGKGFLVRYNGVTTDKIAPQDSLTDLDISALYADTNGVVWIGHESGTTTRYNGSRYERYTPAEGKPAQSISTFLRDRRGIFWYGTNGEGVYYTNGERDHIIGVDEGLPDGVIHAICETPDGNLWLGTDGGFAMLRPKSKSPAGAKDFDIRGYTQKDGLPDNLVLGIANAPDGKLWIATSDSGLIRFDPATSKFQRLAPWRFGNLTSLDVDANGTVWLGTQQGLVEYNPKLNSYTDYAREPLISTAVRSLLRDKENTLWIGTEVGLVHYLGDRFQFYSKADGLSSQNVYTLYRGNTPDYWIGTDDGITRFTTDAKGKPVVKHYLRNLDKRFKVIVSFYEAEGWIWAGSLGGGLFRINPKTEQIDRFTMADGLPDDNVYSITRTTGGALWIGTQGGGIARVITTGNKTTFTSIPSDKEDGTPLYGPYVYQVYGAPDGNLWIATDGGGFSIYDGASFWNFTQEQGLPDNTIYAIQQVKPGLTYLLTAGHGVIQFDGKKFKPRSTIDLSGGLEPHLLMLDKNKHLIVGAEGSLGRYGLTDSLGSLYDESDGLREFDPNLNAVFCDAQGIVWIGTTKGIVKYDPNTESPADTPPPVTINRFRVFLNDRPMEAGLELPSGDNNITFDYIGINLAAPDRVRYQYKLDGFDEDWSLPTQSRFVTFPNLPPGEYTFQVRAAINEGDWTPVPASYSFEVRPPWWMQWWAITLGIIIVVVGTYSFFQYRIRRIQLQNLVLENKVDERTREVVAQKEEIEKKNGLLENANEEILATNDRLEGAFQEIERKNKDITESIVYARRIQQAILPEKERLNGAVKELMVFYRAKDIVSGDFYWFEQKNGRSYFAAVDCTGHGVPGALLSIMGYNVLNQVITEHPEYNPAEILYGLDKGIYENLRRKMTGEEPNDGMDIALLIIDHEKNQLQFGAALRPLYFMRGGELQEIKGSRYPIGGGYEGKEFESHTIDMQPGDAFYIFSDGLVDQFGGPNGRKFTPSRLKKIIQEHYSEPMNQQEALIEGEFKSWIGELEQLDDVMLIGVRPL